MSKKNSSIILAILFIILVGLLIFVALKASPKSVTPPGPVSPTATPEQTLGISHTVNPNAQCHSNGVLPDPNCTPGAVNPDVTQANIHQTICVSGYTKTIRPPASYTNHLKKEQIRQYGYADTMLHDYEEDHLISLEIGGAPSDPRNLWPEPGSSPNPKDKIENLCHEKVCSGEISLADAQHQIATNWQSACQ